LLPQLPSATAKTFVVNGLNLAGITGNQFSTWIAVLFGCWILAEFGKSIITTLPKRLQITFPVPFAPESSRVVVSKLALNNPEIPKFSEIYSFREMFKAISKAI
jgi:hypothetical protein